MKSLEEKLQLKNNKLNGKNNFSTKIIALNERINEYVEKLKNQL